MIRVARPEDWEAIWPFFRRIVAAGETYAYDRGIIEAEAERIWIVGPPGRTVVATASGDAVIGTASMYANRGGPGAHVASASFMVDPEQAGHGTGRALGQHVDSPRRRRPIQGQRHYERAGVFPVEPRVAAVPVLGLLALVDRVEEVWARQPISASPIVRKSGTGSGSSGGVCRNT